jgi:hypothetical protein
MTSWRVPSVPGRYLQQFAFTVPEKDGCAKALTKFFFGKVQLLKTFCKMNRVRNRGTSTTQRAVGGS